MTTIWTNQLRMPKVKPSDFGTPKRSSAISDPAQNTPMKPGADGTDTATATITVHGEAERDQRRIDARARARPSTKPTTAASHTSAEVTNTVTAKVR